MNWFPSSLLRRWQLLLVLALGNLAGMAGLPTGTFQNPLNPGPDPYLQYYSGNYYLTTSQGDCIRMWQASTLAGLKTAAPVVLWRDADPTRSRGIWAPEFLMDSSLL